MPFGVALFFLFELNRLLKKKNNLKQKKRNLGSVPKSV